MCGYNAKFDNFCSTVLEENDLDTINDFVKNFSISNDT